MFETSLTQKTILNRLGPLNHAELNTITIRTLWFSTCVKDKNNLFVGNFAGNNLKKNQDQGSYLGKTV